jgi:DNA invertase Pin-like site-specific DNA recombinase
MEKFMAYYRVSTARQGQSGLEAQKEAVRVYLNGGRWKLVGEFKEVEAGKRNDRPALAEALAMCRIHGATLVVAKLDRVARNVACGDKGVNVLLHDLHIIRLHFNQPLKFPRNGAGGKKPS